MPERCIFSIPNDISHLPLVGSAVAHISSLAGCSGEEAHHIGRCVEDVVAHIIGHAFPAGEEDIITLTGEWTDERLEISIREKGTPYDPGVEACPDKLQGWKGVLDGVSFHNLGAAGKETRLWKRPSSSGEMEADPAPETGDAPPPSLDRPFACEIRPTRIDEAVEITRRAYTCYGYSYGYEEVYYPDRLKELIRSGRLSSFVAVHDGAVIGHAGLLFGDDPGIAELSLGFVDPPFRKHGIFKRLMATTVQEAERRGLIGVKGQGVCTHPYSQKSVAFLGMSECALLLSHYPVMQFTGIATGNQVRESVVVLYRYLRRPEPRTFFVPEHHEGAVRAIYRRLGDVPLFGTAWECPAPGSDAGAGLAVETEPYGSARIRVHSYGADTLPSLRTALRDLCTRRLEVVYLSLPLTDPITRWITGTIEEMGFFFAGVEPSSTGDDRLLLQYLNNQVIDYDRVFIGSAFGEEVKEYVCRCDPGQERDA
ncbi:GNAT family N-acetyltransferase [Methanofollis aquaemaris]|uniref:GNAT family N-acetyltransferase n=1 Tax=Methanofollis aquaemaris TaxID=126734 RepID=A0A8A3S2K5_9EURY|nr:GNAT family N-acetyltransferase [Methanofollis aquaemaris]QSZ66395.1 GNAT family N-acetyltransferase [Methanofollis aquaemaris]